MSSPIVVGLAALLCGCPIISEDLANQKSAAYAPYAPYANGGGWTVDQDCIDYLSVTDIQSGDIAEGFSLEDQHGDTVVLHHFCNQVVLIMAVAIWDGGSSSISEDLQVLYETYKEQGFLPMALLGEGDPTDWSEAFDLTYPVLSDEGFRQFRELYDPDSQEPLSIPSGVLLKPGLEVVWKGLGWEITADEIESYLP